MKKRIFWQWSLGLVLASLPLAGGCDVENVQSASAPTPLADQSSGGPLDSITNAPTPEAAEQQLENATGKVVSVAKPSASNPDVSAPAAEIVKLTQAGVDENVMLSYVTNSVYTFGLSSDDIIYLNDIGVPGTVVTAMIQHDQALKGTVTSAPPPESNQLVQQPGTPPPYPTPVPETTEPQETAPPVVEAPLTPPQGNVSYSYFYDSLSPYGNWIQVDGYGLCWQPTVVVVNREWSPYSDHGHWVYSDYGWYWVSDYSWGWAPFHYGRWFRHVRWGWCWAPDTVWGPSWVTWRYTPDYCGWAPLPPTACYTPGFGFTYFGRSIGIGFSFGLRADCFTFVSVNRFCDPHPFRHRVPRHQVTQIFNNTVVVNQIVNRNNRIINEGIPVRHIADASHTVIRPIRVRDVADPISARSEHTDRGGGRAIGAFRPSLPTPTGRTTLVGQGVRPAKGNEVAPRIVGTPRNQGTVVRQQSPTGVSSTSQDRRTGSTVPVVRNATPESTRTDRRPDTIAPGGGSASSRGGNAPVVRGSDRSTRPNDNAAPPRSVIMRGSGNQNRTTTTTASAPPTAQPGRTPPVQNNSRPPVVTPNPRSYTVPQTPPAQPAQNQRVYRQEPPGQVRQDQRQSTQPSTPTPRQQMPTYQWPPAAEPREQQRNFNPTPQAPPSSYRSEPAPRSEPRQAPQPSFRSEPTPRSETRQAPPARSDPTPQQSAPSRDNRQDRQSQQQDRGSGGGGGSRRNR